MNLDRGKISARNPTRWLVWSLAGQVMLTAILIKQYDFLPARANHALVAAIVLLPPIAYLPTMLQSRTRSALIHLIWECWQFVFALWRSFKSLFTRTTISRGIQYFASLKAFPTKIDEWFSVCLLPFKTCIVMAVPVLWLFRKYLAWLHVYHPRNEISCNLIVQLYLVSLVLLLIGALIQSDFGQKRQATATLRYFFAGMILLFTSFSHTGFLF